MRPSNDSNSNNNNNNKRVSSYSSPSSSKSSKRFKPTVSPVPEDSQTTPVENSVPKSQASGDVGSAAQNDQPQVSGPPVMKDQFIRRLGTEISARRNVQQQQQQKQEVGNPWGKFFSQSAQRVVEVMIHYKKIEGGYGYWRDGGWYGRNAYFGISAILLYRYHMQGLGKIMPARAVVD